MNRPTKSQLAAGLADEERITRALYPHFVKQYPGEDLVYGKMPQNAAFDRTINVFRGGTPHLVAFLEVKARSCAVGTYPTTMVHHHKWEFAEAAWKHLHIPSFYAILFEQEVWLAEHHKLSGVKLEPGFRADRGPASTRLYAYLPLKDFSKVVTL